jgi:hypothetical protein
MPQQCNLEIRVTCLGQNGYGCERCRRVYICLDKDKGNPCLEPTKGNPWRRKQRWATTRDKGNPCLEPTKGNPWRRTQRWASKMDYGSRSAIISPKISKPRKLVSQFERIECTKIAKMIRRMQ